MKRTLGTPTCAVEAREYVVSPCMVWSAHTVAAQSLTPLTTPLECAVETRFGKDKGKFGARKAAAYCVMCRRDVSASPGNAEIGTIKVAGPVKFRLSATDRFHAFILNYFMNVVWSIMSHPLIYCSVVTCSWPWWWSTLWSFWCFPELRNDDSSWNWVYRLQIWYLDKAEHGEVVTGPLRKKIPSWLSGSPVLYFNRVFCKWG